MLQPSLDTDIAISAARDVFWQQGFAETGIEDVVKATGYNRYRLYNAFGDKLGIFLAVLDNYYYERKNIFLNALNDPDMPPLQAIRGVYEFAIEEMVARGSGCLICNVAAEVGAVEPKIAERINTYLADIGSGYEKALTRAEQDGDLNPAITPSEGAAILLTIKLGLGTTAKHGADRGQLLGIFNATMATLGREKQQ